MPKGTSLSAPDFRRLRVFFPPSPVTFAIKAVHDEFPLQASSRNHSSFLSF